LYFYFIIIVIFILINEHISPSTDGLRAQAVYDLAEIINDFYTKMYTIKFLIQTQIDFCFGFGPGPDLKLSKY